MTMLPRQAGTLLYAILCALLLPNVCFGETFTRQLLGFYYKQRGKLYCWQMTMHQKNLNHRIEKSHSEYEKLSNDDRNQVITFWGLHDTPVSQWGLFRAATDSDQSIRSRAAYLLGRHCDALREEQMITLLISGKPVASGNLIQSLGYCRNRNIVPTLLAILTDSTTSASDMALVVTALGNIGAAEAVPVLKKTLISDDWWLAICSAEALAKLGSRDGYTLAAKWLSDYSPHSDIRKSLPEWLGKVAAANIMGMIGTKDDIVLLQAAFRQALPASSTAIAAAIITIMDREGLSLSDWKSNPDSKRIVLNSFPEDSFGWTGDITKAQQQTRQDAINIVEKVTGASIQTIFRAYLRDGETRRGRHEFAQQAAWKLINVMKPEESKPLLEELLKAPDPELVSNAQNRLEAVKTQEERTVQYNRMKN